MRLLFLNNPQPNRQERQYIHNVNQHINEEKPLVIYFYREGCPYCIQTSKEWPNIKQYIETKNKNLLFVEANCELYNLMQNVGEKPVRYPTIRFIHKDNVIPFTKEGPQRNAYTMAKWIDTIAEPMRISSRTQQQPSSMEMNLSNQNEYSTPGSIEMNLSNQNDRPSSMEMNLSNQNQNSTPSSMEMNLSNDVDNGSFEDIFTSAKYPPFSNKFIAKNLDSSQRPSISSSPFGENIQMRISPIKSRRKKRKSLYKSKRRTKRKSLYKSPSYKPRFLTSRKNKLRGKTQMF